MVVTVLGREGGKERVERGMWREGVGNWRQNEYKRGRGDLTPGTNLYNVAADNVFLTEKPPHYLLLFPEHRGHVKLTQILQ